MILASNLDIGLPLQSSLRTCRLVCLPTRYFPSFPSPYILLRAFDTYNLQLRFRFIRHCNDTTCSHGLQSDPLTCRQLRTKGVTRAEIPQIPSIPATPIPATFIVTLFHFSMLGLCIEACVYDSPASSSASSISGPRGGRIYCRTRSRRAPRN